MPCDLRVAVPPLHLANGVHQGRFRDQLRAFCRRRVASAADAEDLVQEILLRLHAKGGQVPRDRFPAWLFRVARNVIVDHYRRRGHEAPAAGLDVDEVPAPQRDEDGELTAELAKCLHPLLARLPAAYAEAVRLADLQGLPQNLLAERLGLSLSGAKSRLQRGRALLRHAMSQCCTVVTDGHGNVLDAHATGRGPACGIGK